MPVVPGSMKGDAVPLDMRPTVIRSHGGGCRAAHLLTVAALLLRTNLRARHRRALLGYLWLIIPGAAFALVFGLLRKGGIITVGSTGIPYLLFVLSGVFVWQGFVDAVTIPTRQLSQIARFLSLVPAPFEAVVIAALGDVLLNLANRVAVLFVTMLVFAVPVQASWLLIPLFALAMVLAGFVIGLLAAPVALLYDDVARIMAMLASFGMLLVPVLFPIPEASLLARNPLAGTLAGLREAIVGTVDVGPMTLLVAAALVLLIPAWRFNVTARPHLAAQAR